MVKAFMFALCAAIVLAAFNANANETRFNFQYSTPYSYGQIYTEPHHRYYDNYRYRDHYRQYRDRWEGRRNWDNRTKELYRQHDMRRFRLEQRERYYRHQREMRNHNRY